MSDTAMMSDRSILRAGAISAPRPASEARITVLSEEQCAEALRRAGTRTVRHAGHLWFESRPGFFERIHLLGRVEASAAIRPSLLCWGFRATLREEDARYANARVPVHVLDLAAFDEGALPPRRRNRLRKSRREATCVKIGDAGILREQGYALYVSHLQRTRHRRIPTAAQYLASLSRIVDGGALILGAFVDGRLAGYVHGVAVDGVGYVHEVVVGTDFLGHQLGTGLNVEFIMACRRPGTIRTLVSGLHAREDPGLDEFKADLGFRVLHVPARVVIPLPLRWYMRARRPHAYYRLMGQ
jgi:hypothetical protein